MCKCLHSNFNIIHTQLGIKFVLWYRIVVDYKVKMHGEGIMSHGFSCTPHRGGKWYIE